MKSIDFPQANVAIAKDQPEYLTLYAHMGGENLEVTTCFELDEAEILELAATGKIWFTQVTFGRGFNPIYLTTRAPFDQVGPWAEPMDDNRVSAQQWDDAHFRSPHAHGPCQNCGRDYLDHYFTTKQCNL